VAGVLHVTTVWAWYPPFPYDAAVDHELVHAFEHHDRLYRQRERLRA
jgi:cytochrome c oxidase assembly factor CtaG